MTTQGTFSIRIDASPEAVWPWVGQLDKHAAWSPKPYQVELVSGEPGAVGSRYRSFGWIPGDKAHGNDVEITSVVPGQHLSLRSDEAMGSFQSTYDVTPAGNGTEVTFRLVFPPLKGLSALMIPMLFPLVGKRDINHRMRLLKAQVEAGA